MEGSSLCSARPGASGCKDYKIQSDEDNSPRHALTFAPLAVCAVLELRLTVVQQPDFGIRRSVLYAKILGTGSSNRIHQILLPQHLKNRILPKLRTESLLHIPLKQNVDPSACENLDPFAIIVCGAYSLRVAPQKAKQVLPVAHTTRPHTAAPHVAPSPPPAYSGRRISHRRGTVPDRGYVFEKTRRKFTRPQFCQQTPKNLTARLARAISRSHGGRIRMVPDAPRCWSGRSRRLTGALPN